MKRDATDLEKISLKLPEWSPFSPDPSLRNIANCIVAQECEQYLSATMAPEVISMQDGIGAGSNQYAGWRHQVMLPGNVSG